MKLPILSAIFAITAAARFSHAAEAPAPLPPVPSERQMTWHTMEQYAFIHFGLNTYTGRNWGYGDEDPKLFDPKEFDADKIVAALKAGGLKGVILTAKHHDGFCLWPTKTTEHNITKTPFRNGKGDVVREIGDACRRAGLKFGIYVSPWDRNNAEYARPGYVKVYHEQIRELLTGYGELFEVWFDGANGGDGWYGGTKEKRSIDSKTYYEWDKVIAMIRKEQPNAAIFGTTAGDIRWVGNEKGYAAKESRPTLLQKNKFGVENKESLISGDKEGDTWCPAECDVSIRPEWFWIEAENTRVRTPRNLLELYFRSVGHGGSFLLNVPPDTRGVVNESD
ncbi:MAG TPA: alpha-L-fucosidase, partial [Luteolibacter sp.]